MFDPLSLLAAFAPLLVEGGKAAISRWIAPDQFKPGTIEQYLQMRAADLDMFKAINDAGGSNPSFPLVEAIVRLQRPLVAAAALAAWVWSHTFGVPSPAVDNFAAVIGFYLFGDRTLFYARKGQGA